MSIDHLGVVACNPIRYPFQGVATLPNTTDRLTESERAAWGGYLRSHAAIVRQLDATLVEAHGLPLTSFEVLARLAQQDEGKQRMSDLAQSVWLSRSGVTRLVDRLERDGLVERQACDSDARGAFAVITDAGRARLETARRTHVSDRKRSRTSLTWVRSWPPSGTAWILSQMVGSTSCAALGWSGNTLDATIVLGQDISSLPCGRSRRPARPASTHPVKPTIP